MKHNHLLFRISGLISCAIISCASIVSCGDDSSSGSKDGGETGKVKTVADLGTCLSAFEGDTYFVEEMNGDYTCTSGTWTPQPSVGTCTDSLAREGAIRREGNKGLDSYGTTFACKDSSWTPATDTEKALGLVCVKKIDGRLADDTTGKKPKTYICAGTLWREATAAEKAAKAICAKNNEGTFVTDSSGGKKNTKVYVCRDSLWQEATGVEKATKKVCAANIYGMFAADSADKKLPLYVCNGKSWRPASAAEKATGLLCDKSINGDTVAFYICKDTVWTKDTSSSLKKCTEKLEGEVAKEVNPFRTVGLFATATDSSYVCDGKKWRVATAGEAATGRLCTEKLNGDTLNWYVCDASRNDWDPVQGSGLGECTAENIDSVSVEPNPHMEKGDSLFVCDGSTWNILTKSLLGTCDGTLQDSVRRETNYNLKSFDSLFVCDESKWERESKYAFADGVPCTNNLNAKVVGNNLCLDGEWREATEGEIEMGAACNEATEGVVSTEKKKTCKSGKWENASAGELATGRTCSWAIRDTLLKGWVCKSYVNPDTTQNEIDVGFEKCAESDDSLMMKYFDGELSISDCSVWRHASAGEIANGKICTAKLQDNKVHNGFVCEDSLWREADAGEKANGFVCIKDSLYRVSKGYVCEKTSSTSYGFRKIKEGEEKGYICGKDSVRRRDASSVNTYQLPWVMRFGHDYICERGSGSWRKPTTAEIKTQRLCKHKADNSAYGDSVYSSYDAVKQPYMDIHGEDIYICDSRASDWREPDAGERATRKFCNDSLYLTVKNGYACDKTNSNYRWRVASTAELATEYVCNPTKQNELTNGYVCDGELFHAASVAEIAVGGVCFEAISGSHFLGKDNMLYKCSCIGNNVCSWEMQDYITDERDNNRYPVVTIGGKTWMANNLRYSVGAYSGYYRWAVAIDSIAEFSSSANKAGYGNATKTTKPARGICPQGWHIPSSPEWEALLDSTAAIFGFNPTIGSTARYLAEVKALTTCAYSKTNTESCNTLGLNLTKSSHAPYLYWTSSRYNESLIIQGCAPDSNLSQSNCEKRYARAVEVSTENVKTWSNGMKNERLLVRCVKD
ncbi:major paralogous domain-containing protein [Fibrobacter intestinalis]|uniref:Major paralogous domain-containing protein n=1 Tax=Fibrobacter intestinalis TaxID=28122 RepID=A0A1M6V7J0_9BACT|nr:FISUMP domain-containing protein [Fibrobacter intestinalis]SHK77418.1 major paralogous domain-containing protein [Fibrobacter intestinalis]